MSKEQWAAVDSYFSETLVNSDPILDAALAADQGALTPQYTSADADAALSSTASMAKAAAIKAAKAKADVADLVRSADALMTNARKLAATVASC